MTLFRLFEFSGVAVAAFSSVMIAGRKNLDPIGILAVAVVTSVGGGTIRDLLLDRHPIFWIAQPQFLYVILISAGLALLYVRWWPLPRKLLLMVDDLSLALFTIVGVQITQHTGHNGIVAALMGVITGCAGGLVRDVMTNEIPTVMRGGTLYATAALMGATLYLALEGNGIDRDIAAWLGIATIIGMRLAAIIWDIGLPLFYLEENGPGRWLRMEQEIERKIEEKIEESKEEEKNAA